MTSRRRSTTSVATVLGTIAGALILALLAHFFSGGDSDPSPSDGSSTQGVTSASASPSAFDSSDASGLPYVAVADLPEQARQTLALIDRGGPFPYDRDGIVFGNFEGLLPSESRGYYHEYTVPTPGESDRGARRIIAGSDGELYWTADHYGSFERIDRS